jgi:hypothetical protein
VSWVSNQWCATETPAGPAVVLQIQENKWCVTLWPCHLQYKKILRQKKNYENSIISPGKNRMFKKIL